MMLPDSLRSARGQSLIEFTLVAPIILMLVLGVAEVGYALLDQHIVTKLTREGSNLISRDTSLEDAATAMRNLTQGSVDFAAGSKLIFSVVRKGATTGTPNYNQLVLYQRLEIGNGPGSSRIATRGGGTFRGAPDYEAVNSDSNTGLQVTNLPSNLVASRGGMIYITEIYTPRRSIAPFDRFGVSLPETLYSIAYF
jgi:hypothetical protein